jgi:heptosyltransferase-2
MLMDIFKQITECREPALKSAAPRPEQWGDGLVVRAPNWLGDAVMALPAMLQMRKALPKYCGLFAVVPKPLDSLFAMLPFVDLTIPLSRAHSPWTMREIASVRSLRAGAGVLLNNSFRDTFYFKMAGVPRLYGASARFRSWMLKGSFKFPPRKDKELNLFHHTSRYLAIARAIGAPEWDGTFPEFRMPEPETVSRAVLEVLERGAVMSMAPGAAYGGAKKWGVLNFRAAAAWWIENGGTVITVGSGKESADSEEILRGLDPKRAVNFAGKTSLSELALILKSSRICVSNDSGAMHLAAALGTPGVAVFGSTDATSTGPVSPNWTVLYNKQPCSPCFKRECPLPGPENMRCMRAIAPDELISALKELTAGPR